MNIFNIGFKKNEIFVSSMLLTSIIKVNVCLFGFYGISTFVGYLMPNPFSYNKQFYFKQFSLV